MAEMYEESKPKTQLTGKAGHFHIIGQGPGQARARYMDFGPERDRVDASAGVEWVFPNRGWLLLFAIPARAGVRVGRVAAAPRNRKARPK